MIDGAYKMEFCLIIEDVITEVNFIRWKYLFKISEGI